MHRILCPTLTARRLLFKGEFAAHPLIGVWESLIFRLSPSNGLLSTGGSALNPFKIGP